jgi:hypothetical protein
MDDIPESMRDELMQWNAPKGVDLETWVSFKGNFGLAVGYSAVFWPAFERRGPYILRKGIAEATIRSFEKQAGGHGGSVEAVLNHQHLESMHHFFCEDASADKLLHLARVLKEAYTAKLLWEFPDSPCTVDVVIPKDEDELDEYQISFWQRKWDAPT